jgi:hypothetical protein
MASKILKPDEELTELQKKLLKRKLNILNKLDNDDDYEDSLNDGKDMSLLYAPVSYLTKRLQSLNSSEIFKAVSTPKISTTLGEVANGSSYARSIINSIARRRIG